MSKYSDPLWQTNPVLAQVREALQEVEHIREALQQLERAAEAFPSAAASNDRLGEVLQSTLARKPLERLDGWCSSLNESEIALHAMLAKGWRGGVKTFVQQRHRFLDEQVTKWSLIMLGSGPVRIGSAAAGWLRGNG